MLGEVLKSAISPRGRGFVFDASQEGLLQRAAAELRSQVPRSARETQLASMNDGHAVAQLFHIGECMGSEEDRMTRCAHEAQLLFQQGTRFGIQAAGRL